MRPTRWIAVAVVAATLAAMPGCTEDPQCDAQTDCASCTAKPACGWCAETGKCVTEAGKCTQWAWDPRTCAGLLDIAGCAAQTNCAACAGRPAGGVDGKQTCSWCLDLNQCVADAHHVCDPSHSGNIIDDPKSCPPMAALVCPLIMGCYACLSHPGCTICTQLHHCQWDSDPNHWQCTPQYPSAAACLDAPMDLGVDGAAFDGGAARD